MCNYGRWSWTGSRLDEPTGGQSYEQAGGQSYVQALSDFTPHHPGELGFRAGDIIQVMQPGETGGWWEGLLNGQAGWFPSNYCSAPQSSR